MATKKRSAPRGVPTDLAGTAVAELPPSIPDRGRIVPGAGATPPPAPEPKAKVDLLDLPKPGEVKNKPGGLVRPSKPIPGIAAATRPARPMPELEQIHAAEICPELFPRESPQFPGMFTDPETGEPCLPPTSGKAQYSALLLLLGNIMDPRIPPRRLVLPIHTATTAYPRKSHEEVVRRIEVVFDDVRMRDKYMKRNGVNPQRDPLAQDANLRQQFGVNPYDAQSQIPGNLGPSPLPPPAGVQE